MGFWVTESLGFSMRAPQNLGGGLALGTYDYFASPLPPPPPSVLRNFNGAGGAGQTLPKSSDSIT